MWSGMFHERTFHRGIAAIVAATLIFAVNATLLGTTASAATFRVTAKIYQGANLEAAAEHWILFDNGLVYDLPQKGSPYVTVYDPAQKQVTLLHREQQVQATLSTEDLVRITAQARAAATSAEQRERLGLATKVEPSTQVIGYSIQFGNFEYHTTTQTPDDPTIAVDYGRFAILAKRMDIARRLGPPPFGRMTLSQYIAAKKEIPLETVLTIRHGQQSEEFRSTQTLAELTDADREKMDEVRGMMTLYRDVPLDQLPQE